MNPTGQPLDDSDGTTCSTQNDATVSSTGWSMDSFDTMASDKTTNIPPISAEYVANLLDYKHVVSVLEQPVSNQMSIYLYQGSFSGFYGTHDWFHRAINGKNDAT